MGKFISIWLFWMFVFSNFASSASPPTATDNHDAVAFYAQASQPDIAIMVIDAIRVLRSESVSITYYADNYVSDLNNNCTVKPKWPSMLDYGLIKLSDCNIIYPVIISNSRNTCSAYLSLEHMFGYSMAYGRSEAAKIK